MHLTLIINTHEQPDYLGRVLAGVSRQTTPPEEVILADDGSGDTTREVFESWTKGRTFRTFHAWQPQQGFRRSRILNLAIANSQGEYLVFLDGDTVPHRRFLEDHRSMARPGFFVQGHRSLIGERAAPWFGRSDPGGDRLKAWMTGQLEGWRHAFRWPVPMARIRTDLHGIRGCNLAIWRSDLERVNGYNEAFVGWGREDSELAVRLMNAGLRRLDVRGRAPCFHLWHPPANRSGLPQNDRLLAEALTTRVTRCEAGLDRHTRGGGASPADHS